jgi:hypothetical protein
VKLIDFVTLELAPGAATRVAGRLPAATWSLHGEDGLPRHMPGDWQIIAAFAAPVERAQELGVPLPLQAKVGVS